jgi:hypothetical protein
MSLSDRLNESTKSQPRFCKVGAILEGTQVSDADKAVLSQFLDTPEGTPGRLTNAAIAAALRAEGFDISNSSVDRHRGDQCACRGGLN